MDLLPDVRKDIAPYVEDSGVCPEDIRTLDWINDARRLLYPTGDWEGTVEPICVRCYAGYFTLPSWALYAKQAYRCKQKVIVENDWFNRMGSWTEYCGGFYGSVVKAPGSYVTFRDWPCVPGQNPCCDQEGFRLEIVFEDERDVGVVLNFQGFGATRNFVSITRTLSGPAFAPMPPGPKDQRMRELRHVIKPKTKGRIRLYGTDGANTILLALYDPDEINPSFARYRANKGCQSCATETTLLTKAKKKFIKYEDDPNQFVDISTDALIFVMQALSARKGKDMKGFTDGMAAAIAYLQKELGGPQSTSSAPVQFAGFRVTGLIE